jgi:hypothetical protein
MVVGGMGWTPVPTTAPPCSETGHANDCDNRCCQYADLDLTCCDCANNSDCDGCDAAGDCGVTAHHERLNGCGRNVACGGTVSFDGRVYGFDNYWKTVTRLQILVDGQTLESAAPASCSDSRCHHCNGSLCDDWTYNLSYIFAGAGSYPVTARVELKEHGAGAYSQCGLRWKTVYVDTVTVGACPTATATPTLDPPKNVTASCTNPGGPVAVSWGASTNAA